MGNSSKVKRRRGHADTVRIVKVVDASEAERLRLNQIVTDATRAITQHCGSAGSFPMIQHCVSSAVHATALMFGHSAAVPFEEVNNG